MRVLEEPFMTREAILAVLRPGQLTNESPFRTLRQKNYASEGLRVDVRTAFGQLLGCTHLYSALNADAARAVRLNKRALAERIAARASELERSRAAGIIRDAVEGIAATMARDPLGAEAPIALQRYLRLRAGSSWRGLDKDALARDWLVHSVAWLGDDEHGQVAEAVMELGRLAHEARVELLNDSFSSVSTFFGVVRRMDAIAAEVEGEDGVVLLVPRDTLEREGLAVLGQAVAMLCEVLPAGGTLILPMPAVMLDAEAYWRERHKNLESLIRTTDPWDVETAAGGVSVISDRDRTWLDRETGRAPNTVPVAPIRRA